MDCIIGTKCKCRVTALIVALQLVALTTQASTSIRLPVLPAPASPVPLSEQHQAINEKIVPLRLTSIAGVVLPAEQYSAVYYYPGAGDITYSRIDVLTQSSSQVKAVMKFADQLSRSSDHTEVLDFVASNEDGKKEHKKFISLLPVDLRADVRNVPMPPPLIDRVRQIAYHDFDSAREQYLTNNYSHFVQMGKTGEYKKWFSIWRFSGNAIGSFLSVVSGGAPMIGKIGFGVATGAMSAALMYYNNLYMNWLTTQRLADWLQYKTQGFWSWLGISPHTVLKVGDETSSVIKWNIIEVGFMGVQALLLKLMGTPMAATPQEYLLKGGTAMGLGFLAQYSWDEGNSELWAKYNRYVTNKSDRAFYETYSALKMVLVSWGQTTAVSIALVYPRVGYPLLGIMAIMGFAFRRVANHTSPSELISNFTRPAFQY